MKYFNLVFTPTKIRRLNELIGFVLYVFAALLFLALVSYSPLDASFSTAAPDPSIASPHNWIGMVGALGSDLLLHSIGISVFIIPVMFLLLGGVWWGARSRGGDGRGVAQARGTRGELTIGRRQTRPRRADQGNGGEDRSRTCKGRAGGEDRVHRRTPRAVSTDRGDACGDAPDVHSPP